MKRAVVVCLSLCLFACGDSSNPTNPSPQPQPTPTPQANRAPTITSVSASPSFGIADIQRFTLSSAASDPDSDALTYTWTVGSQTFTGATAEFTVASPGGAVSAQLSVSDGRGGTATSSTSVTVASLQGTWQGNFGDFPMRMTITQSSTGVITANWSVPNTSIVGILDPAVTHVIAADGRVRLRCKVTGGIGGSGVLDFNLDGQLQSDGRTFRGGTFGSGFSGQPFSLTK